MEENMNTITKLLSAESKRQVVYLGKGGEFKTDGRGFVGWYYDPQQLNRLELKHIGIQGGKNANYYYFAYEGTDVVLINKKSTTEVKTRIKL